MRGFFQRFIYENPSRNENKKTTYKPKLKHLTTYEHYKKRALIAWIVARCTEVLRFDEQERDDLIVLALTDESFERIEEEGIKKEIIQLANLALVWIETNAVIEEEMKSIQTHFSSGIILERVFNEIQAELRNNENIDRLPEIWEIYRDVMYAGTQGKFLLVSKSEVSRYKNKKLLCEVNIKERNDIPTARDIAKEVFIKNELKISKISSYNLIISEAVTNIIKHAYYGKMMIYQNEDYFNIIIEDKGPGFPMKLLPKTTLMSGYSTKESLGQGFTLMMKIANQVILETSEQGSTLILVLEGGKD